MDRAIKIVGSILLAVFISYVVYRNIMLRFIPSSDLVKDEETKAMYHRTLPNTTNTLWKNLYFSNDNVKVSDIPNGMKYNIAYKNTGSGASKIENEELKKAYEKTFGPGTYKETNSFIGGCSTYTYNNSTNEYIVVQRKTCEELDTTILSKIVDVKMKKDTMEIDVVIAYLDGKNKKVYKDCNDDMTSCSNIIKDNFSAFDESDLELIKNSLHKYKFIYKEIDQEYYFSETRKLK